MIRDYATTFEGKQYIRTRSCQIAGYGFLWRFTGIALSAATVLGITASLTFGWMIRSGLDELGGMGATHLDLLKEQKELMGTREALLTREQIEKTAGRLGLYPSSAAQIRKP